MGLRIFETDPDAAKGPSNSGDIVARFRSGYLDGRKPASLSRWRITTGDPELADKLADIYGVDDELSPDGPQEWDTDAEDALEVFTSSTEVEIILDGPSAIRSEMVLWGRNGNLLRRCDGVEQLGVGDENKGKGAECECPASFNERKESAQAGDGCSPSITLYFRLVDLPDAGRIRFQSGSWTFVRDLVDLEAALAKVGGPARCTLALETIKTKKGREFTKPKVTVHGPAAEA